MSVTLNPLFYSLGLDFTWVKHFEPSALYTVKFSLYTVQGNGRVTTVHDLVRHVIYCCFQDMLGWPSFGMQVVPHMFWDSLYEKRYLACMFAGFLYMTE